MTENKDAIEKEEVILCGVRPIGLMLDEMERANSKDLTIDCDKPNFESKPIYIYNVGPFEQNFSAPPIFPHIRWKACPSNKPYELVAVSDTVILSLETDNNGITRPKINDGLNLIARLISPSNPGLDQNWSVQNELNIGRNLNKYGIFYSLNNPPTYDEVEQAKNRMHSEFKNELAYYEFKEQEKKKQQLNSTFNDYQFREMLVSKFS